MPLTFLINLFKLELFYIVIFIINRTSNKKLKKAIFSSKRNTIDWQILSKILIFMQQARWQIILGVLIIKSAILPNFNYS